MQGPGQHRRRPRGRSRRHDGGPAAQCRPRDVAAKQDDEVAYREFTEDLLSMVIARMDLNVELPSALEKDQFVLHYQPVGDLQTGELRGVEALVRWQHPVRGMIPPGESVQLGSDIVATVTEALDRTGLPPGYPCSGRARRWSSPAERLAARGPHGRYDQAATVRSSRRLAHAAV